MAKIQAIMAVVAAALAMAGCSGPLQAGHSSAGQGTSPAGANTSSATAAVSLPVPRQVAQWSEGLPGEVTAVAIGGGRLWMALDAYQTGAHTGTLVEVDPTTHARVGTWPIGGAPAALAATNDRVWVADAPSGVTRDVAEPDTVIEFDVTGRRQNVYHIPDPVALAADHDSVWVISAANGRAALLRLDAGHRTPGGALPGSVLGGGALVACPDGVYAATANEPAPGAAQAMSITRVVPTASTVVAHLPGRSPVSLACQSPGVLAAQGGDAAILYRIRDAGAVSPHTPLPAGEVRLVSLGGTPFALTSDGQHAALMQIDPAGPRLGSALRLSITNGSPLAAAEGHEAAVVTGGPAPAPIVVTMVRPG